MTRNESDFISDKHLEIVEEEIALTLRQAQSSDARAILGLMRHVGKDTPYLSTGPEGLPYDVKQEQAIIDQYNQSDKSLLLVAEVDDQLIALANIATLSQAKQNHVAELGISIVKEYWGYGIGKILLEELINFAQEVGIKILTLEVVTENTRAIHLYQSYGFEERGRLRQRLRHGHFYYDVFIMERLLS